ncbi:hypothetical protein [Citrobacter enshiensis]
MAFGIGGKCYMVVAGDISDVNIRRYRCQ